MQDLQDNARERILESLHWLEDTKTRAKIEFMVLGDYCEGELYKIFREINPENAGKVDNMPPLLQRAYDQRGFPVGYSFNSRITTLVTDADGRTGIAIQGLPISAAELRNTNIDALIERLTSPKNPE